MLKGHSTTDNDLKPVDAAFVNVTMDSLVRDWCVYEVWKDGVLIYLGVSRFCTMPTMFDAKHNRAFLMMVDQSTPISIVVKYLGERLGCYNQRGVMLRTLANPPECNRYVSARAGTVIKCNEDGKTYRSQQEAAQAYGMNQGNLSNHLAGKPGFATIKGKTFTRTHV